MPRINLSKVDDAATLAPVGQYVCAVAGVKIDQTKAGDEMWRVRFKVAEGEHIGRVVFDNLVFSEAAMPRIKLVLKALGIDTSNEIELSPADILGLMCRVQVESSAYQDRRGNLRETVSVPFDGYAPHDEEPS